MAGRFLRRVRSIRLQSRARTFFHHAKALGLRSALSRTLRFFRKQAEHEAPSTEYAYREDFDVDTLRREVAKFSASPLISLILPVHDIELAWLRRAINSVFAQVYPNWELCIADDGSSDPQIQQYLEGLHVKGQGEPRIRLRRLEINAGISKASNAALEMASGDYVAFLDHDDELTRDALFEVAKTLNRDNADVIYSDEDFIDENGVASDAHFKPDYSPELLRSHNYMTHLLVVRRALVEEVGGLRSAFDGAQDYDLILRVIDRAHTITHIPKVLYHWRRRDGSTAASDVAKPQSLGAGRRALEEHLHRNEIAADIEQGDFANYYRVRRAIVGTPLISVLIPFKDLPDILELCLDSILKNTTYPNFEVIGINNASLQDRTLELMEHYERRDERIRFHDFNQAFNYAELNDFAVSRASGEHVVLMNNDIEVLTPDWIEALLEHSRRPEVGAVGAKLYYCSNTAEHRSRTIQHAGAIVGIGGFAGHSHRHSPRTAAGYFNRLNGVQNVSAVTAALLMVKRELYHEMSGLDGSNFKVALNDVDFCLRLREEGVLERVHALLRSESLRTGCRAHVAGEYFRRDSGQSRSVSTSA